MKLNTQLNILIIGLFFMSILNFIDGVTTYIGISTLVASEVNVFMKSFVENTPFLNMVFKTLVSIGLILFGLHMRNSKAKIISDFPKQRKRHIVALSLSFLTLIVTTSFYIKVVVGNINIIW